MPTSSCVCALCLPSRLLHAIRCFLGCVRARRSPHLRTVRAAPLELQVPACIPACAQRPSARTQVYNRAQSSANPTGNVQYYPVVAVLGAQSLFESGPQTDESERINLSPAVQLQDEICFHAMQDKKADTLDASCRTVCTRLQARLLHARALCGTTSPCAQPSSLLGNGVAPASVAYNSLVTARRACRPSPAPCCHVEHA